MPKPNLKLISGEEDISTLMVGNGFAILNNEEKSQKDRITISNSQQTNLENNISVHSKLVMPWFSKGDGDTATTSKEVKSMPENNDFLKYIDLLNQDRRDMEKRLTDERKESEERINNSIGKIEAKVDQINSKIDETNDKIAEVKDKIYENNRSFKWWAIGIIVGVAAIIASSAYAIVQIVAQIR